MKEKIINISFCAVGLFGAFYGLAKENNVVFLIGILFIIIGYIMIRRKLKRSILKKNGVKIQDD